MPKGLKPTSDVVVISGSVTESAANTFTQAQVDLQLDVLNREVFVVSAIDIDPAPPDADVSTNTATYASLSTTSRTAVGGLADTNVLAAARMDIRADPGAGLFGGTFTQSSTESPHAQLEYIGIIATNDFFAQVLGQGNANAKNVNFRVWGYRAQASADIFAALTQSELLSA